LVISKFNNIVKGYNLFGRKSRDLGGGVWGKKGEMDFFWWGIVVGFWSVGRVGNKLIRMF
jgi:hypothetical protein